MRRATMAMAWVVMSGAVAGCNPEGGMTPCTPQALARADVTDGKQLPAFSCWTVANELTVSGGTLDIREGVSLVFAQGAGLRVTQQGRLRAVGTADAPVVFRGQDDTRGAWKGLGYETTGDDNRLEHVQVFNAGAAGWTGNTDTKAALFVNTAGGVSLASVRLSKSAWYGLFVAGADSRLPEFSGVRFDDNERVARVHANAAGQLGGDTVIEGNGEQVVRLAYGASSDQVRAAQTWRKLAAPWFVQGRVTFYAPVTIEAGTTLRFAQGAGLHARNDAGNTGALTAEGTAAAPVVFTGFDEQPGAWLGLGFSTNVSANRLTHAQVRFAGQSGWSGAAPSKAAVFVDASATLTLQDSTISESAGYGLHLANATLMPTCSNVTFDASNVSGAVSVGSNATALAGCP